MGAPIRTELIYFNIDTDIESDPKMIFLMDDHPDKGWEVITRLWTWAAGSEAGYFIERNRLKEIKYAEKFRISTEKCRQILDSCIEHGLFDETMYLKRGILTSNAMQDRYLKASKSRREIWIIEDFNMVSPHFCQDEDLDLSHKTYLLRFPDIKELFDASGNLVSGWKRTYTEKILMWPDLAAKKIPSKSSVKKKADTEVKDPYEIPPQPGDFEEPLRDEIIPRMGDRYDFEVECAMLMQDVEWKDRMGHKFGIVKKLGNQMVTDFPKVDESLATFIEKLKDEGSKQNAKEMRRYFNNWYPVKDSSPKKTNTIKTSAIFTGSQDYKNASPW